MTTDQRTTRARARPMSPDERRDTLVDVTLDLLREHGRTVTTRQIAAAADVAEGTIFRVFDSKDDLVDAAIARSFRPGRLLEDLDTVDDELPFQERMVAIVAVMQHRFQATFRLMDEVGILGRRPTCTAPRTSPGCAPSSPSGSCGWSTGRGATRRPGPRLRAPAAAAHLLRQSSPHQRGRPLTPDQIVGTLLHGLLRAGPDGQPHDQEDH